VRILVTGASGFVGRHLVPALVGGGHDVRALTRRPEAYRGEGEPVGGDVTEPATLAPALAGAEVAYYLVHSLERRDFARRDADAAEAFGAAAHAAGVRRIVYLGGLGDPHDRLSPHLRSRHEVEGLLAASDVPVTTLRAGVIVGDGGTSWEIIRRMVERVPALVVPTWARTRTQPIAIADVVRYLVGVLTVGTDDRDDRTYEIGGAEVLRYTELLSRLSHLEGRPVLQLPVPLPSVRLAAFAAGFVLPVITGVDAHTVQTLLESMTTEVVVRDDAIRRVVEFEPMDYDSAALAALGAKARRERSS
jgi:uncharacterized protein YbjT (DUF2867 family)